MQCPADYRHFDAKRNDRAAPIFEIGSYVRDFHFFVSQGQTLQLPQADFVRFDKQWQIGRLKTVHGCVRGINKLSSESSTCFEQIANEKKIGFRKIFTYILKNLEKFMFFCPFSKSLVFTLKIVTYYISDYRSRLSLPQCSMLATNFQECFF